MCSLKGNLQTVSGTVHSTASGERRMDINEIITYHTKLYPCSFKGNSPLHSAPVHSTASGERRENLSIK